MEEMKEDLECDGMWVRIVAHDCFDSVKTIKKMDEDIKDLFTFAYKNSGSFAGIEEKYPAICFIDKYGHTAVDGLSYVQLVNKDLPKLRSEAEESYNTEIVEMVNKLEKFITENTESNTIVVFDGM